MEAALAVVLLLIVFLVVNTVISIPDPTYSDSVHDFKESQDIMETLSGRINFTDSTFLEDISDILKENKNSKRSVSEVSQMCQDKFDAMGLKNYRFSENNVLDGKVLAYNGDYDTAEDVSVATRNYGDYSYTLSVWQ